MKAKSNIKIITPRILRSWALPQPDAEGDKEDRGRVLVIGGAPEMPGAVILAATAALRAGAGKLQIATCRSIALYVATAVPESLVVALPETRHGGIARDAAKKIAKYASRANAILIGPGMVDEASVVSLVKNLLPHLNDEACLILDAAALEFSKKLPEGLHQLNTRAVLTPHAGEMANITGATKDEVMRAPLEIARQAAKKLRAIVALKGAETFIVAPDGETCCNRQGNIGLATSGSGDTLSGIIAGLAARGATPLQAAAWGVYLHARAGDKLAARIGRLGFLARELLAEIPVLMHELEKRN